MRLQREKSRHFIDVACYLINCLALLVLEFKTPYSSLNLNSGLFSMIHRVLGCVCFVHVHHPRNKLSP